MNCSNCDQPNPRFQCSKCKQAQYCRVDCQKTHWSAHKSECKSQAEKVGAEKTQVAAPESVKIVVVHGDDVKTKSVPFSEVNSQDWEVCQIPTMVGVPLKVKRLSIDRRRPDREIAIFLMAEPVTGLAAPKWQTGCGVVAFARSDNKDFTEQLFWDVYSYCFHLMDYYGEDDFDYARFRKTKLIPQSFLNYQKEEHRLQADYARLNQ